MIGKNVSCFTKKVDTWDKFHNTLKEIFYKINQPKNINPENKYANCFF